jgi:invasion protein IalB
MNYRIVSAPAGLVGRTFAMMAATSIIAVLAMPNSFAQQPPAPAPVPAKPAPAAPAKPPAKPPAAAPAKPAATAPAPAPAAAAAKPDDQSGNTVNLPPLIYSQWIKFCVDPKDQNTKQVCLTGIDGRLESGMPMVAAVVIEPTGDAKKILRVTLPVGMHLQHGTRFIIDQSPPATAPYVACFANGCISDYELTTDILGKLKKGKAAVVQGISYTGGALSVPIPLVEFAKAYDGPPTDPKVLEERQKKLEEELQRKANEARQKLEGQQGQQQPGAAPQAGK